MEDLLSFSLGAGVLLALLATSGLVLVTPNEGATRDRARRLRGGAVALGSALLWFVLMEPFTVWLCGGEPEYLRGLFIGALTLNGPLAPWSIRGSLSLPVVVAALVHVGYGLLVSKTELGLIAPPFHALVVFLWGVVGFFGVAVAGLSV